MKDENMEWEKEAPILAALPRINPYRTPENYFSDLSVQIISISKLGVLNSIEQGGFKVPSLYFENLGEQIERRISFDKIKEQDTTGGFMAPPNYFEKLQASILTKTSGIYKPEPRTAKLWRSDWIKYASAACFVLLVASGLYVNQQKMIKVDQSTELNSDVMLYNIDESVIIEHLKDDQHATNNGVSQKEIENYILDNYSSSDLSNNL